MRGSSACMKGRGDGPPQTVAEVIEDSLPSSGHTKLIGDLLPG